jgi:release factor glutamine methyltransferase
MTKTDTSIKSILFSQAKSLKKISTTPRLDLEILICNATKKDQTFIYTHPEYALAKKELNKLNSLLKKRLKGIPIAYILGEKEFWNLKLKVSKAVLIPRPETEHLVELALNKLPKDKSLSIADLGTGSGAIALALARERPNWQIIAIDKSNESLKIARENAKNLQIKNVLFKKSDWCEKLPKKQKFSAIISNPPYIPQNDRCLKTIPLKFEPQKALKSGNGGMDAFKIIISTARKFLEKDGWLILEHGWNQDKKIRTLLKKYEYKNIFTHNDLAKKPRVTFAQN